MCLHEIIDIIIISYSNTVKLLMQQIKLEYFCPHYESYLVDSNKIILNNYLNDITYFSSFPINISKLTNGQLTITNETKGIFVITVKFLFVLKEKLVNNL